MILFYPFEEETRLITLSQDQLRENLKEFIKPLKGEEQEENQKIFLFNGIWDNDSFSISLKLKISNNFIPIIHGTLLTSDEGILIRLTYALFPSTKKLLMFWTILTLLITAFFIGIHQAWLYGAISFGFCLVNYILSRENFRIQVRKSKRMLDKMLS